ncbi:MAG: type IV pilus twitching motility protein PilT [Verrucomicrobiota bacterium]|nr:type IV pilus twitching motility protein PilT [Verrucomicrobiota bacterium]
MAVAINELLDFMVESGSSDLHIVVGSPPACRMHGAIRPLELSELTPADTEELMKSITSDEKQKQLREVGSADFGFSFGAVARFRVSVFKQKGFISMVLRQISNRLLTLDEIGLPPSVAEMLHQPRGLILVTGPTGSGKSSTLASMINYINETRPDHIITVEDPIEFFHSHKKCIVNQREIGTDTTSFAEALRRALREDPDVILVGEMRDLETMEAAINASETGHLVFGTLHTTGAARTVDRIVGAFPTNQQEQVRMQLAGNLKAVISQLLIPKKDGKGRVAAFEIMVQTAAISARIRDNKTYAITSDIQTGSKHGMISMDAHLVHLLRNDLIDLNEVMSKCQDPENVRILLNG